MKKTKPSDVYQSSCSSCMLIMTSLLMADLHAPTSQGVSLFLNPKFLIIFNFNFGSQKICVSKRCKFVSSPSITSIQRQILHLLGRVCPFTTLSQLILDLTWATQRLFIAQACSLNPGKTLLLYQSDYSAVPYQVKAIPTSLHSDSTDRSTILDLTFEKLSQNPNYFQAFKLRKDLKSEY